MIMRGMEERVGREAGLSRQEGGFTLVEVLVTMAVIALLVALVLPGMRLAVGSARSFKCQMGQRATAFDFAIFADSELHGNRGADSSRADFSLETFQESLYGVDEFWRWGDVNQVSLPDAEGNDPMRCTEVRGALVLARNIPCSSGAVGPPASVSYAFNLRLFRAEVLDGEGRPRAVAVRLKESILEEGAVPLLFDGDGARAAEQRVNGLFSAPSLGDSIFGADQFWFPSTRHNGSGNYVFVDGHVASSSRPVEESGWRWDFAPVR